MPGLADRLNELFRTVRRPGTTELWNNETAAWQISRSGPPVSAAYLSQLRTGKRLNPSARHLAALAEIFQVDMESFFLPADPPGRRSPAGRPSSAASRVVPLLDGVSAAGVATIESAIAQVRAAERLPAIGAASTPVSSTPTPPTAAFPSPEEEPDDLENRL